MQPKQSFDIGFGCMGNGIAVYNRLKEVHGDYQKVAHIEVTRDVAFYESLPAEVADAIRYQALTSDPTLSTSQPEKRVFHIPPVQDDFPDMLERMDELPESVQQTLLEHGKRDDCSDYRAQGELQRQLVTLGYALESGLDGEPYDLREMSTASKGDVETVASMLRSYNPNLSTGMSM